MAYDALEQLASLAGIAVDWADANGLPQRVQPVVLQRVLAALGHPADSDEHIAHSTQALKQAQQGSQLPPMLTVDYGQPLALARWCGPGTPCRVLQEDGAQVELRLDEQAQLPGMLPVGYHQVEIDGRDFTMAVAPAHCYSAQEVVGSDAPRLWGLGAQLYSLRRPGDGGFGDMQALEALARAAGQRGADALAISPIHAMFSSDTERYSPYSPSSRLFLNSLYASPASVLGADAVRSAIERTGLGRSLSELEKLDLVDWPAAAGAKQVLLRSLFDEFQANDSPLHEDLRQFRHTGGQALENHCRFEALQADHARRGQPQDWRQWAAPLREPRSEEVAAFAQEHADEVAYYAFCQWLIARSLENAQRTAKASGMRVGLVADLAVGADGAGSQAWGRQDELLASLTVGAPPDILNRAGQSWGISAFSPQGLVRHGYRAFIEMLRANFAHAGGLRIDHVLGLNRLWVIPQGDSPRDGAYLHYPLDDMLRLLALESQRHRAIVLGEDLGTVPEGLREKLAARRILGMRVLLFEQHHTGQFKRLEEWPDNALATSTTHDLAPLKGWWRANDIDWSHRLGLIDDTVERDWRQSRELERQGLRQALAQDEQTFQEDLHTPEGDEADPIIDASVRFLGHTRAPLVLLPVEDALGLVEAPNLPGTVDTHPNWRRRLPLPCEVLLDDPHAARRLELLAAARQQAQERDR
ncbi:4-alpha-glucanotransferase [Pseudomonas typographi]|uniref:4-alpha-glucanotransferase n=1 Tax=Pseudomonas typographi TaxID=2715964 RepID=A0ABR7Z737_9PSED|nr:4-alpha-glucanotransferase [Pseudomonas typographi]MBD1554009.1 4-alpha-glucanotransferase [Pseudomonas typographi]MBD1589247.1 4-alpha-glucanotransferase [Pseudomonas typographi]MBD1601275.1 4-alpha-glucanotransferase [Pseudomonas typographi]